MKTYKIKFEAYAVVEPDGGGMHDVTLAYFADSYNAHAFAREASGWPRDVKHVTIEHTYNVLESVDEYHEHKNNSKRRMALSKLTEEEQALLGLK